MRKRKTRLNRVYMYILVLANCTKINVTYIINRILNLHAEGDSSSEVVAKVVGNRTDLVQLVEAGSSPEKQKYMVCDFTKWEKLAKHSKRDHCKNLTLIRLFESGLM